ncbi:hypothetical protein EGT65_22595 [Burkholderia mallei]|uniref:Uncharacterized protein n=1 Tax=Burkholderia mallei TaxID=13373 RepID=A0AAX1X0D8_BURML|nr:hypothetical protein BOC46_14370 [Burkholderia pseudomallei]KOS75655.1 hypothetical protein DM46_1997 [Burkholderia mallei]KOS91292.1 hypothetical protein DM53_4327 [Burkholderia mallei]KOS93000.1 hypothetical protein DM45_3199 [Burkholderia mallei]KOS96381.1 hypothetical protein DM49_3216 [Burkholderia mallei]
MIAGRAERARVAPAGAEAGRRGAAARPFGFDCKRGHALCFSADADAAIITVARADGRACPLPQR